MSKLLPTDAKERKTIPLATGLFDYFPSALIEVAHLSHVGNEQHNPGEPLHWARGKSADQEDTMLRHFAERGTLDLDGVRHSTKMAWRALAILQLELETEGAPVARGARTEEIAKTYTQEELDAKVQEGVTFVNECNARQAKIIAEQVRQLEELRGKK